MIKLNNICIHDIKISPIYIQNTETMNLIIKNCARMYPSSGFPNVCNPVSVAFYRTKCIGLLRQTHQLTTILMHRCF